MTATIQQHLKKLKPAHRDAALTNMKPSGMTELASDIGSAIAVAFDWVEAPEGYTFWSDICHELIRGEYHFTEEESKGRSWRDDVERKKTDEVNAILKYCSDAAAEGLGYGTATLPTDSAERKTYPIYSGFIRNFPNAIAAVSHLSYKGSKQHHPDKPIHWDKTKSSDELDALMRHMIDGEWEQVAWRAMGNLERKLTGCCQYTNNKLDK